MQCDHLWVQVVPPILRHSQLPVGQGHVVQVSPKALIGPRPHHMATGLVETRRGDQVGEGPCWREEPTMRFSNNNDCSAQETGRSQLFENGGDGKLCVSFTAEVSWCVRWRERASWCETKPRFLPLLLHFLLYFQGTINLLILTLHEVFNITSSSACWFGASQPLVSGQLSFHIQHASLPVDTASSFPCMFEYCVRMADNVAAIPAASPSD